MPFDAVTTAAVADDLRAHLLGGRVERVIQSGDLTIALLLRAEYTNQWLILSAHAQQARVQRTLRKQGSPFGEPSAWVMLLRKYLEGARLQAVAQQGVDRVLHLTFQGGPVESTLIAEVMGKYSNIILVDRDFIVLGAFKLIRPEENRVRVTLPRHPYLTPPRPMQPESNQQRPKRDPLRLVAGDLATDLAHFDDATLLWKALLDVVDGLSPTLAREVVFLATGALDTPLSAHRDLESAGAFLALIRERFGPERGQPGAVWREERLVEWAAFPLHQHGLAPRTYPDIAALLDEVYTGRADVDGLAGQRGPVLGQIEVLRKNLRRKIASLEGSLPDPEALQRLRERGEMILAYQHSIEPGQRALVIPELELTIPLDPELTPLENAQRAFKQYQKGRDAGAVVPGLLEAARHDLEYLDQIAVHAALATDPAALAAVRADLREATGQAQGKVQKKSKGQDKRAQGGKTGKAKPGVSPMRVRAGDGTEIVIGRSARQNDAVTFQMASPQDIWLHARQIPGAHVILRTGGRPPSKEALLQAAALAAANSQGRGATTVPVDYTAVRNVRRIKGGKPGLVHYSGETTVNVRPGS